jgi:hypothetical protein
MVLHVYLFHAFETVTRRHDIRGVFNHRLHDGNMSERSRLRTVLMNASSLSEHREPAGTVHNDFTETRAQCEAKLDSTSTPRLKPPRCTLACSRRLSARRTRRRSTFACTARPGVCTGAATRNLGLKQDLVARFFVKIFNGRPSALARSVLSARPFCF